MTASQERMVPPAYRADIDGLRALAIVSVALYHAFPKRLPGGFVGVDVFFVISGYLITGIIVGSQRRGTFSVKEFYARRIKRIFPALIVVLAACLLFGWLAMFADELRRLGIHILGGAGFASNFLLWHESGYFDASAETKPLLHLWSLGIEEQFYLLWPALLVIVARWRGSVRTAVAVVAAASLAANLVTAAVDPVADFYAPYTRLWELLIGAGLAASSTSAEPRILGTVASTVVACIGGLALLLAIVVAHEVAVFPAWFALLPTLGTAAIISAGPGAWLNRSVLARRIAVAVGQISYPLYLWHWPALYALRTITFGVPSAAARVCALFVAALLAILTYRFVERPVRAKDARRIAPGLAVLMAMVASGGLACLLQDGFPSRYVASPNDYAARAWHLRGDGVTPCDDLVRGTKDAFCATTAAPAVALIGDSHAGALFNGFLHNDVSPSFRHVVVLGAGSCQPTMGVESKPGCDAQLKAALAHIVASRNIQTVVLAGYYGFVSDASSQEADHYAEGFARTFEALRRAGKGTVFVVDNPSFEQSAEYCQPQTLPLRGLLSTFPAFCREASRKELRDQSAYLQLVERLRNAHPDVLFFDAKSILCDERGCPMFRDGKLLYGDYNHLSIYGSRIVANALVSQLVTR